MPRFNHMELTLPPGELTRLRPEIREFFSDVFGFDSIDVPIVFVGSPDARSSRSSG